MTDTMKQWTLKDVGRANLGLVSAAVPAPAEHEILVKVSAVSLNYRDLLLIEDGLGFAAKADPFVLGSDAAGVVVAAGAAVTRFKPGERVISTFIPGWIDGPGFGTAREPNYRTLGGAMQGVLSEYIVLDQGWAVKAPESLNDVEASTLPCAGLTAWTALVERGRLHAGQTVVVQGTGGVALFGLQIAAAHGADVIVVSGDDDKLERAKALGARHGINRKKEDWVEAVYRLTGDRGADHILEIVGGAHLGRALQAAAVFGRVSLIGVFEGFDISGHFAPLALKHLTVEGIQVGHRKALEDFVRAIDQTGIKPVVDAEYAFADLPAALDHLARGPFGKIVMNMPG
ncbi:NAD(P)-dependent alcohol dehydrogenase [Mesorhizobium camelthorni]|uniref:NAD(P)-dependent alcohol dehydrogenase n=2 Tax=Allomesorhizobium camelthorni TaxID=475069 RepID=A0A6G4WI82_9HYPH|nr:NAD(P)-dependent alcohol dehydrogenase [Mesorhizobium camelthorni]